MTSFFYAAAAAWYAEAAVRFLCVTFAVGIAGVEVNEDGFCRGHGRAA